MWISKDDSPYGSCDYSSDSELKKENKKIKSKLRVSGMIIRRLLAGENSEELKNLAREFLKENKL